MSCATTVTVAGTLLVAVANYPGGAVADHGGPGYLSGMQDPYRWVGWLAIALVVACVVWAALPTAIRQPDPWAEAEAVHFAYWTTAAEASAVLAIGCGIALIAVVRALPEVGPAEGLDLSLPLTTVGLIAAGLGTAAMTALARRRRTRPQHRTANLARSTCWLSVGGGVALAAISTLGLARGVVPAWVTAVNTESTTTDAPAPETREPVLDGTVAWSAPSPDPLSQPATGTAGGVALRSYRGVRMLDPSTGDERWSYQRWDVTALGPRHRDQAVDSSTAAASPDGRRLAMTVLVDAPRARLVDGLRDLTRLWVFDAVSGRQLADIPVADSTRVHALDRDTVTISTARTRDDPATGGVLLRLGFDGSTRWRHEPRPGCGPDQVAQLDDGDTLVMLACNLRDGDPTDPGPLLRIDRDTGTARWTWHPTELHQQPSCRAEPMSFHLTATVALIADQPDSTDCLAGIRLRDGTQLWDRTDLRYGLLSTTPTRDTGVLTTLPRTAGDSLTLQGIDATTGTETWTDTTPHSPPDLTGAVTLLRDGRLVLVASNPSTPDQRSDPPCLLATWDTTTGQRHNDALIHPDDKSGGCSSRTPLIQVPGGIIATDLFDILVLR